MLKLTKELGWFIKKYWYWYLTIIIFGTSVIILALEIPRWTAEFLRYIEPETADNLTRSILLQIVLTLSLISILLYVSVVLRRVFQSRLQMRLSFELRQKFLNEIVNQDAPFFEKYNSGDLINRATGDIFHVRHAAVNGYIDLTLDILMIILTFTYALTISTSLTFLSIIPLPLVYIISHVLRPKIRKNWRKLRKTSSDMNNAIMENVSSVRLIRSNAKEETSYQKLKTHTDTVYNVEKRNLRINTLFGPLFQSISTASFMIALYFGGMAVINETMTASDLVQFFAFIGMLVWPLMNIGMSLNSFNQSLVSLERLNEIFYAEPYIRDKIDAVDLKEFNTLEFKDYSFKYSSEEKFYTLKDINLTIKAGETLGIVGKTGSGKTTLIRQLTRQYPIFEGDLLVNDTSIEEYRKKSVRYFISYVPQEHILFTRSVRDNILVGTKDKLSEEEIMRVCDLADFSKDLPHLSEGLDTIVGEYGVTLSGGQKQRLAIARAFLKNADILILDDSLSAVDGNTEAKIIKNIIQTRKEMTNIIICHRLSAVKHADKIIVLNQGKIVETGTHQELMALKGWYYEQYNEQLIESEDDTNENH
ncbi:MAG: ABC transporter ATP-binding protein/permease [Erysipelotrichales bacterium]|nr:ABC transporter ATP-binding protein/permease [Erysipelotrichales bacterium]